MAPTKILTRFDRKSKNRKRISQTQRRLSTLRFDSLEDRRMLATMIGLTSLDQLVRFDSATPGTTSAPVLITGQQAGEDILGIDFRPSTGQLYGLGDTNRLYIINPISAVATEVATLSTPLPAGATSFGIDFNPVPDRLRITTDTGENFRVNVDTGAVTEDGPLAYAAGDANDGATPNIVGSAYTNSFAGAATTTLYGIDSDLDILVTQSPPNNGTLNTVGTGLGVDTSALVGFDIISPTTAFAALNFGAVTGLYSIDLTTGAATLVGSPVVTLDGLAAAPAGATGTGSVFFVDDSFLDPAEDTDGDNEFSTIQAAIDAAADGDIIYVAPGLYPEDGQVEVNKSVILIGAQGGLDARTAAGNSGGTTDESIVTARFLILNDNVTIDGFRIQGVTDGAGIQVTSAYSGYRLLNNYVTGNVYGLGLESSGVIPSLVQNNLITANILAGAANFNGIYSDVSLDNVAIDANEFSGHATVGGVGINLQSTATTAHADVTISNNLFEQDSTIFTRTTNLDITGNTFNGTFFRAIDIAGGVVDALISGNTFNSPEVSSIFVNDRSGSFGVTLGENSDVVIDDNTLNYDAAGIFNDGVVRSAIVVRDTLTNATVSNNTITIAGDLGTIVAFNGIEFGVTNGAGLPAGALFVSGNTVTGTGTEVENVIADQNSAGILVGAAVGDPVNVDSNNVVSGFIDGVRVIGDAIVDGNSSTGNVNGLNVIGGTALVQNNDLNGNSAVGLLIQNGAVVDAGQTTTSENYTGLGVSTGGNDFGGYTPGVALAISNQNVNATPGAGTQFPPDVRAQNNTFFATDTASIEQVVLHENDLVTFAFVDFSNAVQANRPPVADDDTATTDNETAIDINVLDGDTDEDGDTLTVTDVTQPAAGGSVTINPGGQTVRFTPTAGFVGDSTFTYTVSDGNGGEDTATVTVTVTAAPQNQPPVADNDTALTDNATAINIPVLVGDFDPDGDSLTVTSVTQPAAGGTVSINAGGQTVRFVPTAGFVGNAVFTYTVSDGNGGSDTATVTVVVSNPTGGGGGGTPSDPDTEPRDGTNLGFVRNLYEDLLDRTGDAGGINYWVDLLERGELSRNDVATFFLHSPEYVLNLVQRFYQTFLGRSASATYDFATNQFVGPEAHFFNLMHGDGRKSAEDRIDGVQDNDAAREENVIVAFVTSEEYRLIKGQTNDQYVENLYNDILGRPSDPSGKAGWGAALNGGSVTRTQVARAFVNSSELNSVLLNEPPTGPNQIDYYEGWFQDYFDGLQEISQPGFDEYFDQLEDDELWRTVQANMLASGDYYDASGNTL